MRGEAFVLISHETSHRSCNLVRNVIALIYGVLQVFDAVFGGLDAVLPFLVFELDFHGEEVQNVLFIALAEALAASEFSVKQRLGLILKNIQVTFIFPMNKISKIKYRQDFFVYFELKAHSQKKYNWIIIANRSFIDPLT